MKEETVGSRLKWIRITGLIGLSASILNAVSDVIFQGNPTGVYSTDPPFMWQVSEPRLLFGAFLGTAVIPLAIVGFWHVYQGIRRAGRFLAAVPVLIGAYTGAVGSAVHFSLLFPALVGRSILESEGETDPILTQLFTQFDGIVSGFFWVVLGFMVFSIWWMILVLLRKTEYPRWFGFLNPTFMMIGLVLVLPLIPGAVASYLFPASSALSFALFFAISTRLLWNSDGGPQSWSREPLAWRG